MPEPPISLDLPTSFLEAYATESRVAGARLAVIGVVKPALDAHRRQRVGDSPKELQGQIARDLLSEFMKIVRETLICWAQDYSPLHWLWLLRRLPNRVFEGAVPTTLPYDRALAEIISTLSQRTESEKQQVGYGYFAMPYEPPVADKVLRFACGVEFLAALQRAYRWAAKDSPMAFWPGPLPHAVPSDNLKKAVIRYDQRVATSYRPLSRVGSLGGMVGVTDPRESILTSAFNAEPESLLLPVVVRLGRGQPTNVRVPTRYPICPVSIAPLVRLISDDRIRPSEIVSREIGALVGLLNAAVNIIEAHQAGWRSMFSVGYLVWEDRRRFERLFSASFRRADGPVADLLEATGISSAAECIEELEKLDANDWPLLPGAIFRCDGEALCVDLATASARLEIALQFPKRSGVLGNVQGGHFEDEVQALVDLSDWRPGSELRALRQRQLRISGTLLTDLDAVAERGTVALLISCKAEKYSPEYDAGDHSAVRNAADRLRLAHQDWSRKIATLCTTRVGDNFDLSRFAEIVGVVCTPSAMFVDWETATSSSLEDLPSVVCAEELESFLGRKSGSAT